MNISIGDTVWFHHYGNVKSGEVVAILDRGSSYGNRVAGIKTSEGFTSYEITSNNLYVSGQEAVLALAEKKQQEASRLLREAADLFKEAGGMRDAPKL